MRRIARKSTVIVKEVEGDSLMPHLCKQKSNEYFLPTLTLR